MKLYLDDVREPVNMGSAVPASELTVVRTAQEAIDLVKTGQVEFISFDHDLGTELTGYDVAKVVENLAAEGKIPPIDYQIHSANPVGAGNIDQAMKSAWRFWDSAEST